MMMVTRPNSTESFSSQQQQKSAKVFTTPTSAFIPAANRNKFAATVLWKDILKKFYHEMPLRGHKRQFKLYEETFTGKEATDFMQRILPLIVIDKTCDRPMAIALLKRFMAFRYLANARDEMNKEFCDNITLYRFCNDKINAVLDDSPAGSMASSRRKSKDVRRASSLKASSLESYHRENNFSSSPSANQSIDKSNSKPEENKEDKPSENGNAPNNANSDTKTRAMDIVVQTPLTTKMVKTSAEPKQSRKKQSQPSIWSSSGSSKQKMFWPTASGSGVNKNKFHRSSSAQSCLSKDSAATTTSVSDNYNPMPITDVDEFKLWRCSLLEHFRLATGIDNVSRFFGDYQFHGSLVKWNCKNIHPQTQIISRHSHNEPYDEVPRSVLIDLSRLSKWPESGEIGRQSTGSRPASAMSTRSTSITSIFLSTNQQSVKFLSDDHCKNALKATYPKKQLISSRSESLSLSEHCQIFDRVARALQIMQPLVPTSTSESLLELWDYFQHKKNKLMTMKGIAALAQHEEFEDENNIEHDQILCTIPSQERANFLSCIRMNFLTLRPNLLRKIQLVFKYLQRIIENQQLPQLFDKNDLRFSHITRNRYYILKQLSSFLIKPLQAPSRLTEVASLRLTTFIIDNVNNCLFDIPKQLESSVQRHLGLIINGKEALIPIAGETLIEASKPQKSQQTSSLNEKGKQRRRLLTTPLQFRSFRKHIALNSPEPTTKSQSFCRRVEKDVYDEQSRSYAHLVVLLEQILANENLKPAEKFENLNKFRVMHPKVYAMRFPSPENDPELIKLANSIAPTPREGISFVQRIRRILTT